jgi:hypothetical protein
MNTTSKMITGIPSIGLHPEGLAALCRRCYERVLRGLAAVKSNIERQFGRAMAGYEQLLQSAVNEAEAVAWQTPYPHLFFPVLAEEKALAAQQWANRQRVIHARTESFAAAA